MMTMIDYITNSSAYWQQHSSAYWQQRPAVYVVANMHCCSLCSQSFNILF